MYNEADLLPIAALQHLAFCPRQWGLMYLEGIWNENRLTSEGGLLHEKTDEDQTEVRSNIVIARGLRLRSLQLGLVGRADVVEFHLIDTNNSAKPGISLEGMSGKWRPFPVEYKRGKPKIDICDEVQLCAQTLCLEEMLKTTIIDGAIFYGEPRRRTEISFDDKLRESTIHYSKLLRELTEMGKTPQPVYEKKCNSCSLINHCLPRALKMKRDVGRYLKKIYDNYENSESS